MIMGRIAASSQLPTWELQLQGFFSEFQKIILAGLALSHAWNVLFL